MTEDFVRPSIHFIRQTYDRIFHSSTGLERLRDTVISGRFFKLSETSEHFSGRSILWKVLLLPDHPLDPPSSLDPPLDVLRSHREAFRSLLLERMRAPDGSYEEGFSIPGGELSADAKNKGLSGNLDKNNPLSLHDENPWNHWFTSVELRKIIRQDVERTFPDIGYFRNADVQTQLTNILFLHSVTHEDIGYRQGMHELLAPIYYAVDLDSVTKTAKVSDDVSDDLGFEEFCSRPWIAADAWVLFSVIMRGARKWYEWREPSQGVGSPLGQETSSPFTTHVQLNVSNGRVDLKPYVAPIIAACEQIQSQFLKNVDPLLCEKLTSTGIEPQVYGIRWLRLLFTREFTMGDAMILWDGLFACDPSLEIVPWICVAMLLRIRNSLIPSDYTGQLTHLLHYPPPPPISDSALLSHHITLLLRQALALQMSPTPLTGASVVYENSSLLDIPARVPDTPSPPRQLRPHDKDLSHRPSRSGLNTQKPAHLRQQSSPPMGLPEMFARGLLDRGESLGINKTLMSAVSELRRNLPDIGASLVRTPSDNGDSYSTFPLTDERPTQERPPWEPRSRFEMERDLVHLRSRDKLIGKSISQIVDNLLQDEEGVVQSKQLSDIRERKRESLERLSYIRDALDQDSMDLDGEHLFGTEEFAKLRSLSDRRDKDAFRQTSRASTAGQLKVQPVYAPNPLPVVDSQFKQKSDNQEGNHSSSSSVTPRFSERTSLSKSSPIRNPRDGIPRGPPPPHIPTPGLTPLAPWHSTPSNFSNAASHIATLPRIPPRTSTTWQRQPISRAEQSTNSTGGHSRGAAEEALHDPLGVLR